MKSFFIHHMRKFDNATSGWRYFMLVSCSDFIEELYCDFNVL